MRVVAMVGVLSFGLADGFYEMSMDAWGMEGAGTAARSSLSKMTFPPPRRRPVTVI